MNIDLGNSPVGTPPTTQEKEQIAYALGVLPLAGGTMADNATIGWDNASAIREAGEQGLEIECSVGYRWQWVAGRMILRMVNSGQIARILAIDGVTPGSTNDITEGFVPGTRWETADGTVYVCGDATEDAAVWAIAGGGSAAPYAAGSITGATTLDFANGTKQNASATGNVTLNVSNGADFDALDLFITASGAARTLSFNAAISLPSDSAISFPVTIDSGKGCRIKLEKHGSKWTLVSLVKSYTL